MIDQESKELIIASFIFPERQEWFFNYLNKEFGIKKDKVFLYKNIDDESKVIFIFKLKTKERLNLKELFPSAVVIHKRNNCFFTVNSLNKLIEIESKQDKGNINYKDYKIDWSKHQNQIILIANEDIIIYNIEKIL